MKIRCQLRLLANQSQRGKIYFLAFDTTIGIVRFKRLLYGINSTGKVYQKAVSSVVSDIQGSINSQDDKVV